MNINYLKDVNTPRPGDMLDGKIISISNGNIELDMGLKSESWMSFSELKQEEINNLAEGSFIKVYLISLDDGHGRTIVSREKARYIESLNKIEEAFKQRSIITAKIIKKIRGGYAVCIQDIRAFLPLSLSGREEFEPDQIIEILVNKISPSKDNIIVTRRDAIASVTQEEKNKILESIQVNDVLEGTVKNITNFGAFVDLGKIDGLIHIGDLSWERIDHPSEVISLGQKIKVSVIKKENNQISLSLKAIKPNPWLSIKENFKIGDIIEGPIKSITNYGLFIELKPGIEGLAHRTQISWDRIFNINEMYKTGQNVKAAIKSIEPEKYKIGLSIKDCMPNPWKIFSKNYKKYDQIEVTISKIKPGIGIFVSINQNLSGLIKEYDLSWKKDGKTEIKNYEHGQKIKACVLNVDINKQQISLGIKQVNMNYIALFASNYSIGSNVQCTVLDIGENRSIVTPDNHIEGIIKTQDLKRCYDSVKIGDKVVLKLEDIQESLKKVVFSARNNKNQNDSIGSLVKEKMGI